MRRTLLFTSLLVILSMMLASCASPTAAPVQPTSTPMPTPAPTLSIGTTMIGKDGATLVYVPEGIFTMGSDTGGTDTDTVPDEKPVHKVILDAFWIDQTEVTNKQYAACVSGGGCTPPSNTSSSTRSSYYGNSEFDEFPVVFVDWNQANTYCLWTDRELPTEAQWEKAARGTDARIYPWGNDAPNDTLLNYDRDVGETTKVGSYEKGKSIYGTYDMSGNVWEWVNDWYQSDYYTTLGDNASNPRGPSSGKYRVLHGGAWYVPAEGVYSSLRYWLYPTDAIKYVGFRCASSTAP